MITRNSVVIDFSQGVDRQSDTTPAGLVGCITPSGMPYYTLRGGLITGIEALRLQGIPTNNLSLTRESQKELQNMAGNAMSTPVVGAAIIAALIHGFKTLSFANSLEEESFSSRVIAKPSQDIPDVDDVQLVEQTVQTHTFDTMSADSLICLAASTVSKCSCEGPTRFSNCNFFTCKGCGQTTCRSCRGTPYHEFQESTLTSRRNPSEFKERIINALPMRLYLEDFVEDPRIQVEDGGALGTYLRTAKLAVRDELKFSEIKRSQIWTVIYKSLSARLELRVSSASCSWFYFPLPKKSWACDRKERKFLEHPAGRMIVEDQDLLAGHWKFRWPITENIDVIIHQKIGTRKVPSWLSKLGIPKYANDRVPMEIFVSTNGRLPEIDGDYMRLPACGTACGSLYIRKSQPQQAMYLFLDPDFLGDPEEDRFVFSSDSQRLVPGQSRPVIATIPNRDFTQWLLTDVAQQTFRGRVEQKWLNLSAKLKSIEKEVLIKTPAPKFDILQRIPHTYPEHCTGKVTPIFKCDVPEVVSNRGAWKQGPWLEVTDIWEHETFTSIAWLTSRCAKLGDMFKERKVLSKKELGLDCQACSPRPTSLKWKPKGLGYQPFEDPLDASKFESAIKARPKGIIALTRKDEAGKGNLLLGIHVHSLAHRALAGLSAATQNGNVASHYAHVYQEEPNVSWRLLTDCDPNCEEPQQAFTLINNNKDTEVMHVFHNAKDEISAREDVLGNGSHSRGSSDETVIESLNADEIWPPRLRAEQARSLHWMLSREDLNAEFFDEEEVEEAHFAPLSWLLDVRARRKRPVLGGVVADGVGYGKTITTLALIERQKTSQPVEALDGRIPLKATLILVTAGTLPQWKSEARKFLGTYASILTIQNIRDLVRYNVEKLKTADIIIVACPLITSDPYLNRLAQFAAIPPPPTTQSSRAFTAWLQCAIKRTKEHIAERMNHQSLGLTWDNLCERREGAETDKKLHEGVPFKRKMSDLTKKRRNSKTEDLSGGESEERSSEADKPMPTKGKRMKPATKANDSNLKPAPPVQAKREQKRKIEDLGEGVSKKKKYGTKKAQPSTQKDSNGITNVGPFNMESAHGVDTLSGPLFEMLEFQRIVVDEFTYLNEKERASINSLTSLRRWILSGTPPLEDFADIQRMASFLGVYLGKDDLDKGAMTIRNFRKLQKEQTGTTPMVSYFK